MQWIVIKVLIEKYKLKKFNLARIMKYYGMESMVSDYYLKVLEEWKWNNEAYKVYKKSKV